MAQMSATLVAASSGCSIAKMPKVCRLVQTQTYTNVTQAKKLCSKTLILQELFDRGLLIILFLPASYNY